LETWYHDAHRADWESPSDIKNTYQSTSFLANNRVVFNNKGNCYRLVVVVYQHGIAYVRFVGTYAEYDQIDATTI